MDVKELQRDVENRMRNGETYSLKEIRQIMKKTGLSYAQVISRTKRLKKEIEKAEEDAEKAGKPFDRDAYVSARMNGK